MATDIEFQNQRAAIYANRKRSMGPPLGRGDKVYLLRKNIKTRRPSTKLDFKKLGPFEILDKVGKVNYRLQLPANSKLHPVFHISLLEPVRGNPPIATDAELQPENEPEDYEVESILDKRTVSGQVQYLIKWKGYEHVDNTWEPVENLSCPRLLEQFHRRNPEYPRTKERKAGGFPRQRQGTL